MIGRLIGAWFACAAALTSYCAQGQIFTVTQDSFVNGNKPDRNYGSVQTLKVRAWQSTAGLIQFDVSALRGRAIASAILSIDVEDIVGGDGGVMELRLVESAWSEGMLTFNTQPGFSEPLATVPIAYGDIGGTVSVAITGIVRGWADATIPNYGLALTSAGSDTINARIGSGTARLEVQLAEAMPVTPGTVNLKWAPPHSRTDGTPLALSEIAGYVLQMNGSILSNAISADVVTVTVSDLWPGEYCFQIATRDLQGHVGPFSPADCWDVVAQPQ